MSFQLSQLVRIGTAFGRTTWMYRTTTDLAATIQGSGYFNAATTILAAGDWILAEGSDGAAPLYVVTNSGGVVTTAAATSGAAVSVGLLNISGGTLRTVQAADLAADRDLIPFHSDADGGTRVDYADHFQPKLRAAYRAGRYYGGDAAIPGVTTTFAVSANVHYATPFVLYRRTNIAAIASAVTTLHASNYRMGLYANADGLPGALLLDAGEISASGTGVKDFAAVMTLDPGIYWLTSVYAGTPTLRAAGIHTAAANLPEYWNLIGCAAPGTHDSRISNSLTYGALPSVFGAVSYAAGECPGHYLKAA